MEVQEQTAELNSHGKGKTMALTHSIATDMGVDATYFHIHRRDIYDIEGVVDIGVRGYVSEQARLDGKENIFAWSKRYELEPEAFELTKQEAYAIIKQEEIFSGAQDS